jgi:hypothetical protein
MIENRELDKQTRRLRTYDAPDDRMLYQMPVSGLEIVLYSWNYDDSDRTLNVLSCLARFLSHLIDVLLLDTITPKMTSGVKVCSCLRCEIRISQNSCDFDIERSTGT